MMSYRMMETDALQLPAILQPMEQLEQLLQHATTCRTKMDVLMLHLVYGGKELNGISVIDTWFHVQI